MVARVANPNWSAGRPLMEAGSTAHEACDPLEGWEPAQCTVGRLFGGVAFRRGRRSGEVSDIAAARALLTAMGTAGIAGDAGDDNEEVRSDFVRP